jgi:monofunctional biosynthetic peptidoglycan transglycosylase
MMLRAYVAIALGVGMLRRVARSSRRRRSLLGRWLRRGVLAGFAAIVAATALPLAWLRWQPPWFSSFMLHSHFADPATGEACRSVDYRYVPWDRISPQLRRAVVVAEDQRFLEHAGFDMNAIEQAVVDRALGESDRLRGASTISQQLAKNLFLWPGRSVVRKAAEAWYTSWLELVWPKRRILELYLNVAQFGPCRFGVGAASAHFFGVPAARLSPQQAALLAAVLPSPAKIRADDPGPYARQRSREILEALEANRDATWLRGL